MKSADRKSPNLRRARTYFLIVTCFFWCSMYIYVPVLTPYLTQMGASYTFAGVVLASYGLMQLILRLPIGLLSDYLRKRRLFLVLGMAAGTLSCMMFALTEHLGVALLARALSGVMASTWVAVTVLYASYFPKEEATKAMGTIQFVTVASQMVIMGISGYVTEHWGWKGPFWVGSTLGAIGLIMSVKVWEPPNQDHRETVSLRELGTVIRDPLLLKASVLSILAHSILFITMFGFTPEQALLLGAGKDELGLLTVAFMLPHAVTSILAGNFLAKRFNPWMILAIGFLGSGVFTALTPLAETFLALCLIQIINGLALGLTFPLLMGMSIHTVDREKRATAMGFYQAVYSIGMVVGPFFAGWISASPLGLAGGFVLGGIIGLVATAMTLSRQRREWNSLTNVRGTEVKSVRNQEG